jgi:hypothetical protein
MALGLQLLGPFVPGMPMRLLAVLLVIVQMFLRGIAAGHAHPSAPHAPTARPHFHLTAGAHDHRQHHHRGDHTSHDHGHDHESSGPIAGARPDREPTPSHDRDATYVADEGVILLSETRSTLAAREAIEWLAPTIGVPGFSAPHLHPSPRRVRPPGDPASPFLTILPHVLRV